MLELANCTIIQIEVLHCEYDRIEIEDPNYLWSIKTFINTLDGEIIFRVSAPRSSICNDPKTWILDHQIIRGERKPTRHLIPHTKKSTAIANAEELLAIYYRGKKK